MENMTDSIIEDKKLNMQKVRPFLKLELKPSVVHLKTLLDDTLAMIKDTAAKRGIKLSMELGEVPKIVRVDAQKLKQAIYNLLSNALKFTPRGGEVFLKVQTVDCIVRSGRRRGDSKDTHIVESKIDGCGAVGTDLERCIEFSVSDNGIGIKADDLERIFDLFEQVEGVSSGHEAHGTGLGLFFAKRLVAFHGGIIWAESNGEGRGATFNILLPG